MQSPSVAHPELERTNTDLPFKVGERAVVVLKNLPILQCARCVQYLIEDPVFSRVEQILGAVDDAAELEIIRYAA